MQSIIIKNLIEFKFIKRGCESGVEINFGQGLEFWSCKRGTDRFDFDALLEHFVPNIDFEQITPGVALWWEQELYRMLSHCKQQRSAKKMFTNYCTRFSKKYGGKIKDETIKNLITNITSQALSRIYLTGKSFKFAGSMRWQDILPCLCQQKPLMNEDASAIRIVA